MKERITIDVNVNEFTKTLNNEEVVIVKQGNGWVGMPKSVFLKEQTIKIQDLENEIKRFTLENNNMKVDNELMKKEIELFKRVLVDYGFNLLRGEN